MVFIGLGFACLVRQSIDIFNGFRVETNFFDWLMTNFSTVLFVFQNIDNPSSFLTHDKFTDKGIADNNLAHRIVEHNELYLTSLHDFPSEMGYWEYVYSFIKKYERRMDRLKNIIQTKPEKINFIHYIAYSIHIPTIEQIYYFIMAVQNINPYCNFCLHLLIPPELNNDMDLINNLKISTHVDIHYMTSNGSDITLQRTDLNWSQIYSNIQYS
jgi:hypothetical protein